MAGGYQKLPGQLLSFAAEGQHAAAAWRRRGLCGQKFEPGFHVYVRRRFLPPCAALSSVSIEWPRRSAARRRIWSPRRWLHAAGLTRVQTGGLLEIALAIVAAMHVLGAPRLLQTCARVLAPRCQV